MSTTGTRARDSALDTALSWGELPELSSADRLALRLGVALILRAQHHAERLARAEQARLGRADELAARSRDTTFASRHRSGPTW